MGKTSGLVYGVLVTLVLYFASPVLIPFVLALFLAVLLDPLVAFADERGVSRRWGAPIVTVLFAAGMLLLSVLLYRSIAGLTPANGLNSRFSAVVSLIDWAQSLYSSIPKFFGTSFAVENVQKVQVVEAAPAWTRYLVTGVGSLFSIITITCFVPVLIGYLLSDKENLTESFNVLMGRYIYLPRLNRDLPLLIRSFFSANIVAGIFMVAAHAALFWWLGFQNWAPIAILSGLAGLLPLIGLAIALALPAINGILATGAEFPLWQVAVGVTVVHLFAFNVILPFMAGSRMNLNSGAMLVGLLFWGWLWGATGVVLAVPLTSVLKSALESNPNTQPWANLLSVRPKHVLANKPLTARAAHDGAGA